MLSRQNTPKNNAASFSHCKRRYPSVRAVSYLFVAIGLISLAGCTTYTWPDGSQKTVIGVPTADENSRYEENTDTGPRYRVPGEVPPKKDIQE